MKQFTKHVSCANRLKQAGATLVAVGVTNELRAAFLKSLTNFDADVFTVTNFDLLGNEVLTKLVNIICDISNAMPGTHCCSSF